MVGEWRKVGEIMRVQYGWDKLRELISFRLNELRRSKVINTRASENYSKGFTK